MTSVGQALKRKEDPRMITGRGNYTEDIQLPGMLHAVIVRSPEAHAEITAIDTSAAKERRGVVAAFTGEELAGDFAGGLPMVWAPPGVEIHTPEHWPVKRGQVKHVGDPVAVVVATSRGAALDAAEQVIVDYDPKPAVVDPEQALEDGAPLVWDEFGTNKIHEWGVSGGDFDAAAAEADVTVDLRLVNHRTSGAPIEARCSIAEARAGKLTLYSTTQVPHIARFVLAGMLGIAEDKLRVVAPDVGGGFGAKLQVYAEEALVLALAKRLGRPVKWTETRSEHMTTSHHGRDQINYITLTAKRDGTVTGCRARTIADLGAYQQLLTPFIPTLGFPVMGGCYPIPAIDINITGVFTNKMCTDAIRGAGRPEATYWIELAMDKLARELDMDPLELRRKNFIGKDQFPFETALGIVYDSGNYEGTLDRLLERFDVGEFRREQESLRQRGVHRGVGFSTYVEVCGLAPSRAVGPQGVGLNAAFYESANVRVTPTGSAIVYTGISPHGQGLDTSFAQIAGDILGIDPENVEILHGDTDQGAWGWDTYGSRSLSVGGEALARAARKVQDKAKRICAALLEAAPEDIELVDGKYQVQGLAGQVDDDGRGLGGGAHPAAGAADRHRARSRGERVLRPRELRVPVRGARVRRRRRRRDRQGQSRPLRVRRRLRPRDQPDADRRPDPRRHHPRDRAGALRAGRLRRRRAARHRHVRRLRATDGGGAALVRDGPDRDALADQLARRQGRRGGRHDRRDAGRRRRRAGRATPARRRGAGHAAHADAGVAGDPGSPERRRGSALDGAGTRARRARRRRRRVGPGQPGRRRCGVIPAEFDYEAPESLDEAVRMLHENGEDAKLIAGGHSLLPLMKLRLAAPSLLVDLRRVPGLHGIQRENGSWRIGAMTRHADLQDTPELGVAARRRAWSPTSRCATAGRSAGRWRTATPPRTCQPSCWRWRARSARRARTACARSPRRTCSRTS